MHISILKQFAFLVDGVDGGEDRPDLCVLCDVDGEDPGELGRIIIHVFNLEKIIHI